MLSHRTQIVVTGRFQRLHWGHLQYIHSARYLADCIGAGFAALTGPRDDELSVHAFRKSSSPGRRPLRFEERRLLLSIALDLDSARILNHSGSPHHGEPGLSRWADGFFAPLIDAGRFDVEALAAPGERNVVLFVAVKKQDRHAYREPGLVEHYSEVLKARYPALSVVDLFALSAPARRLSALSSSALAEHTPEAALPPVSLLADALVTLRPEISLLECEDPLRRAQKRFADAPAPPEAIDAIARDLLDA